HAPATGVLVLSRRNTVATLADQVVELPGARTMTSDVPEPDVAAGRDTPFDTSLLDAMAKLPEDTDVPLVDDAACERSDEEPGLRSMLRPLKWGVAAVTGMFFI